MKVTSCIISLITISAVAFGLGWTLKPAPSTPPLEFGEIYREMIELKTPADPSLEAAIGVNLFDNHHDKAVQVFDQLPGFGFSRILPAIRHDFKNSINPDQTTLFSDYDFTFIGNDADSRRLHHEDVPSAPAIFASPRKGVSSAAPASAGDLVALEEFEADPVARRHFQIDGDSIVGYGPLRATASCAKCHGVEEGTLLGMFRYRFDLPLDSARRALASVDLR